MKNKIISVILCILITASVMLSGCEQKAPEPSPEPIPEPQVPANLIEVNGLYYSKNTVKIDFSGIEFTDFDSFLVELSKFEGLKEVNMYDTNLTFEQRNTLVDACPEVQFNWLVDFDGKLLDSKTTEFLDLERENYAKREDFDLMGHINLLTALKKIDMCGCGYTNEQMELFVERFPDTKVVWEINLAGIWTVRTDAVAFSTMQGFDMTHRMTSEEAAPLKYCTDLVALDLGHNDVTDLSFLQYMPELRILILVDAMEGIIDGEWRYIKDLSMLKYCPKLVYLEYFCNQVTDLSFLQYLPNLVDLNLSWSPVSDYTYLKNLPNIERLYMMGTSIPHHHYLELCELYPDARIERYGENSIDKGWREHPRFYAMRYTFANNTLHPMFE